LPRDYFEGEMRAAAEMSEEFQENDPSDDELQEFFRRNGQKTVLDNLSNSLSSPAPGTTDGLNKTMQGFTAASRMQGGGDVNMFDHTSALFKALWEDPVVVEEKLQKEEVERELAAEAVARAAAASGSVKQQRKLAKSDKEASELERDHEYIQRWLKERITAHKEMGEKTLLKGE
jgi:hypothetical protein